MAQAVQQIVKRATTPVPLFPPALAKSSHGPVTQADDIQLLVIVRWKSEWRGAWRPSHNERRNAPRHPFPYWGLLNGRLASLRLILLFSNLPLSALVNPTVVLIPDGSIILSSLQSLIHRRAFFTTSDLNFFYELVRSRRQIVGKMRISIKEK